MGHIRCIICVTASHTCWMPQSVEEWWQQVRAGRRWESGGGGGVGLRLWGAGEVRGSENRGGDTVG